uniref:Ribonuclease H-like domain-containing protein n=1 Tax=Tanacetum cinerariifolium TaxID=118510 RepID=A0A699HX76_TANCI|nr:ribonuclease H-like domain-containing protein [Tanacetum cinerariifolium]
MDLKWQVAMLSMWVKQFYKKTGRKLEFNGKEPVGFDKTKVECFNCHRKGHFARDCRSTRNSGNRSRDAGNAGYRGRDNDKSSAKEEDEKALVVQAGLGTYDWSYQVKDEATDFALMDFTSNPLSSSSLNYKKKVIETMFDNCSSGEENSLANDRLDDSIYKFKISETTTSLTIDEKDAHETSIACVEKPNNDKSSAPLIQDWDTDSDNDRPEHIPSKIDFVKADGMAKKSVLLNHVGKETGHKECRPVWNNIQRINHKNKFAPIAAFTRFGRIPVSAAKPKVAASTSASKPVNTTGPKQSVNLSKSRSTFHKSHSPIIRSFYNATTHSRRNSTERVNTAGLKAVSVVKGNRVTTVKISAGCVWRPRVNDIDHISKDNRWICIRVDYVDPQGRLNSGEGSCSGPGRQETMRAVMAQIRSKGALIQSIDLPLSTGYIVGSGEDRMEHDIELMDPVPQTPHDLPLSGGHTPGSDEGSMTLKELTDLCATLLQKVFDLENVKTAQAKKIVSLKKRITKLEQCQSTAKTVSTARPDISAARLEESTAERKSPPTTTTLFDDEDVTIADTLVGSEEDEKRIGRIKKRAVDSNEEHRKRLKVVPGDDKAIDYETLDVKSLIVDCESQVLGTNEVGDIHVYKLTRLDGSYRHFLTFSRMLKVLDRQDVLDLHKINYEKRNQQDWKLLSWKLYKTCGVHTLMLDDSSVSINMFIEKRYPLTKEILKKMPSSRLEAETENTLALDLIKFIKLQIEEK